MDIVLALSKLRPGEEWSIQDNDFSTLKWLSSTPPPTLEELQQVELTAPLQAESLDTKNLETLTVDQKLNLVITTLQNKGLL
jgi:hypothetical protein